MGKFLTLVEEMSKLVSEVKDRDKEKESAEEWAERNRDRGEVLHKKIAEITNDAAMAVPENLANFSDDVLTIGIGIKEMEMILSQALPPEVRVMMELTAQELVHFANTLKEAAKEKAEKKLDPISDALN